jgi:hypothetical protein
MTLRNTSCGLYLFQAFSAALIFNLAFSSSNGDLIPVGLVVVIIIAVVVTTGPVLKPMLDILLFYCIIIY